MKRQLIIQAPADIGIKELSEWIGVFNQSYAANYPLVLPDGFKYDVVECDEINMLMCSSRK